MDDALELLRLQIEWGADEALGPVPVDRSAAIRPTPRAAASLPVTQSVAARPGGVVARAGELAAGCADLRSLQEAVAGFDGIALRDTAGQLVFGAGPAGASLAVIIEAPSAEDDASGSPLSGGAGRLFDAMLASVGLSREALRLVCLVPWRPPGGRPPTAIEIAACRPFLLAHLRLLPALDRLVMMGNGVTRSLASPEGQPRLWRGRWLTVDVAGRDPLPALATASIESIASDPRQKETAWTDLIALRRRLDGRA